MVTAYRIVLIHQGRHASAQALETAVHHAVSDFRDISELLEFSSTLSDEPTPQVVAYLASASGKSSRAVNEVIDAALDRDVSILPIASPDGPGDITWQLPDRIAHLNAASWAGDGTQVATMLLAMLGLVEKERKVFISYRRSETSALAVQIHTELAQRRFDVFLDRFAVEPGVDFQPRLYEELGDKAFVLLLESPELRHSRWVRDEIAYAQSRRIEFLALTLPGMVSSELVSTIDDAFRLRLDASDLSDDGTLSPDGLAVVLDKIELGHARALRRRREQILGSVRKKLQDDGCTCSPVDDWCVVAHEPSGRSGLFWVTPRRPEPTDFHSLSRHHDRVKIDSGLDCLNSSVVHEAGRLAADHQNLLDWLSRISGRGLATVATCSV